MFQQCKHTSPPNRQHDGHTCNLIFYVCSNPVWKCHTSDCLPSSMLSKPHTHTCQSRMISVNPCQAVLPLLPDIHTQPHTHTQTHRGLTPQDSMSGKDLRTHFQLGWAIEWPGGPLGCWSLPTLRLPLLLHHRSTASSRRGQPDRDESILCWHSRL